MHLLLHPVNERFPPVQKFPVLLVRFALVTPSLSRSSESSWLARGNRRRRQMRVSSFAASAVQGFHIADWYFFTGFGCSSPCFLLFAAVLAWRFGSMSAELLVRQRLASGWAFAAVLRAHTPLSHGDISSLLRVFSTIVAAGARSPRSWRNPLISLKDASTPFGCIGAGIPPAS